MSKIEEVREILRMAKDPSSWEGTIPFEDFWTYEICRLFEPIYITPYDEKLEQLIHRCYYDEGQV